MEELTPLVTKICVLQEKAPLEVSREKRQLLELLEKRHRRYVEKKSCEALELESLPSCGDQLISDGGLDKGDYSSHSITCTLLPTCTIHAHLPLDCTSQ